LSEKSVGNQFKEIKRKKAEYLTNMFLLKVVIHQATIEKPQEIMLYLPSIQFLELTIYYCP
jgi:hypothetical protein